MLVSKGLHGNEVVSASTLQREGFWFEIQGQIGAVNMLVKLISHFNFLLGGSASMNVFPSPNI